jgi:hypothetical protein
VRKFLTILLPLCCSFLLAGCAALGGLFPSGGGGSASPGATAAAPVGGAATASVPSFMDELEPSTRLAIFSPAALLDGNIALERTVLASQCRFRTADPPILVPTANANKTWAFNGRIEEAKSKSDEPALDAEALEYRSWFGLGSPKQQLNTWPLAMVTLSEMPEQYLEDRIAMLSDHQQQMDKAQMIALTHHYIENSQNLQARVQLLVGSFDPSKCPTD